MSDPEGIQEVRPNPLLHPHPRVLNILWNHILSYYLSFYLYWFAHIWWDLKQLNNLKWKTHINNICKKANSTLGFLRRNLRHCPKPCRKNAYLALVRSKVEYGSIIWDPYNQSDIDRLERIQRSAARFITRDYRSGQEGCVTKMLQELDLYQPYKRGGDSRGWRFCLRWWKGTYQQSTLNIISRHKDPKELLEPNNLKILSNRTLSKILYVITPSALNPYQQKLKISNIHILWEQW